MRRRLLIVDDEIDVLGIVTEFLDALGYDVIGAMNGREAVDAIDRAGETLAAAVVDWTLPDMAGLDVVHHLRARHPRCPIIVTTGHTAEMVPTDLGGSEPATVLRKPFTMRSLAVRIEGLLEAGR